MDIKAVDVGSIPRMDRFDLNPIPRRTVRETVPMECVFESYNLITLSGRNRGSGKDLGPRTVKAWDWERTSSRRGWESTRLRLRKDWRVAIAMDWVVSGTATM